MGGSRRVRSVEKMCLLEFNCRSMRRLELIFLFFLIFLFLDNALSRQGPAAPTRPRFRLTSSRNKRGDAGCENAGAGMAVLQSGRGWGTNNCAVITGRVIRAVHPPRPRPTLHPSPMPPPLAPRPLCPRSCRRDCAPDVVGR